MKKILSTLLEYLLLLNPAAAAATRLALAVTLAVLLALLLHFDKPYWSAISVVAVMQPFSGITLEKGLMRIFGTIAGAIAGLFLAAVSISYFPIFALSCFVIVASGYYFSSFTKYPYAYFLGALTAFLIMGETLMNPASSANIAFWRVSEVLVGVFSTLIVTILIQPESVEKKLEASLKKVKALQTQAFEAILSFQSNSKVFNKIMLDIRNKLDSCNTLVKYLEKERNVNYQIIIAYNKDIRFLQRQNRILHDIYVSSDDNHFIEILQDEILDCFTILLEFADDLYAINHDLPDTKDYFSSFKAFEIKLSSLREQWYFKKYPVACVLSFIFFIDQVSRLCIHIEEQLHHQLDFSYLDKNNKPKSFWHPFEFKNAITSGLGAVVALCFWLLSNLPGGIQGIISSYVISTKKNICDKKSMAAQRILGCIAGGFIGLLSIAYFQFNLIGMLGYLFVVTWIFGCIAFSGKSFAYIGIQANMAFFLSFVQARGFDSISPALERLAGILIGIISIFIASYLIMPVKAEHLFNENLTKAARLIYQYLKKPFYSCTPEQLRDNYFKVIELNNQNIALLSTLKTKSDETRLVFYENASEVFERLGSLMIQITRKNSYPNLEDIAKVYCLNLKSDMAIFMDAMHWLISPYNYTYTDKLSNTIAMFKKHMDSIRTQNLNQKKDMLLSRELIHFYYYLNVMLKISQEYQKSLQNSRKTAS